MKKQNLFTFLILILSISSFIAMADDHEKKDKKSGAHKHSEEEKHDEGEVGHAHEEEGKDEHGHDEKHEEGKEKHAHGEGDENEENGETSSSVGPDKGVQEASEKLGIKLSPEAIRNFGLKTLKVSTGNFTIPKSSIVMTGEEKNIYRLRGGFYKRVDFDAIQKNGDQWTIRSQNIKAGDEIVVLGVGFLRIAEVAAFDTSEAGHHH